MPMAVNREQKHYYSDNRHYYSDYTITTACATTAGRAPIYSLTSEGFPTFPVPPLTTAAHMFSYERRQPTLKGALSWGQDGDTEVAESVRRRGRGCEGGQIIPQMPTLADVRAFERERRSATPPCMPTLWDAKAFDQRAHSRAAAAAALRSLASPGSDSGSRLESQTSQRRRREAFAKQWWIDSVVAKGKMPQVRSHTAD